MSRKYIQRIPRKPLLKRETYNVPETYKHAYHEAGITNPDELIMLFHLTQFGGFRMKKVPKNMHFDEDFLGKWFKRKYENGYQHFRANVDFLQKFGDVEIKPLERRWRCDAVNDEEMKEQGYSNQEIEDANRFLWRLNDFYSSIRLDLPMPTSGITAEDRLHLAKFHGIPFLRKKPRAGGRFFHPESSYQRINSQLRRMMTIDGEKTTEIDLTAATLQFINISLGVHCQGSIEDTLLSYDDPYDYFLSTLNSPEFLGQYEDKPIEREALKDILYTTIYSSENRQESNVNRKLRFMQREYRYKNLVSLFPDFFDALSELRKATNSPLHLIINREESRYAQRVLEGNCFEYELPVLPLHDSFITTISNGDTLEKIMDATSQQLYGRKLAHRKKY